MGAECALGENFYCCKNATHLQVLEFYAVGFLDSSVTRVRNLLRFFFSKVIQGDGQHDGHATALIAIGVIYGPHFAALQVHAVPATSEKERMHYCIDVVFPS